MLVSEPITYPVKHREVWGYSTRIVLVIRNLLYYVHFLRLTQSKCLAIVHVNNIPITLDFITRSTSKQFTIDKVSIAVK